MGLTVFAALRARALCFQCPRCDDAFGRRSHVDHGVSPLFLKRSWYGGDDAHGFALFQNDELACLCWFWGPRRFNDPLLWTLRENEAMLADIVTAPSYRGRNFAP